MAIDSDDFKLTFAPLDVSEAYQAADTARNGAVVLMSGMVRDRTDGRAVDYLDYQAYDAMAFRVFGQIALECRQLCPDLSRVVIHHRLGKLRVGEISVLIAVGSPHRVEAFTACRHAIDSLKQNAPIWKKEYWLDGDSTWVKGINAQMLCP
ncbi:molybdenum cofactor biosynthesis protein MoaE [Tumidithrix helvetica PCC 7403]|uniref:molybdenum cofactor biosynthesis protein MoaE n=1 Tax=Tumidithrix helvetica TaxID=3457545 RepID=UPI003C83EE08